MPFNEPMILEQNCKFTTPYPKRFDQSEPGVEPMPAHANDEVNFSTFSKGTVFHHIGVQIPTPFWVLLLSFVIYRKSRVFSLKIILMLQILDSTLMLLAR